MHTNDLAPLDLSTVATRYTREELQRDRDSKLRRVLAAILIAGLWSLVALAALVVAGCGPAVDDAEGDSSSSSPELAADVDEPGPDGSSSSSDTGVVLECDAEDVTDCCTERCPGACVGPSYTELATCACPMDAEACTTDEACAALGCALACLVDTRTGAASCGCSSDSHCAEGEACTAPTGELGAYGVCA